MARNSSLKKGPDPFFPKKAPAAFLEVAGIRIAFEFAGPGFRALVARRYENFISPGKPLYRFSVSAMAGSQTPFKPVISAAHGVLRLKRGDFDCVLDLKTGHGILKAAPRVQTFDSFLRSFYSWLLPREGGLLVHSSAFEKGGSAFLFPGVSGAGKSTLSRLAAGKHPLLSDELVPIRKMDRKFYAFGSPFWGEMKRKGKNKVFPLGGVYKLSKAPVNSVGELSGGGALRLLLRCSMNFSKDAVTAGLILRAASELAVNKNAGELRFSKKDASFLKLIN